MKKKKSKGNSTWSGRTAKIPSGPNAYAADIRANERDTRDAMNDIRRMEAEARRNKKTAIRQFKLK